MIFQETFNETFLILFLLLNINTIEKNKLLSNFYKLVPV